MRETFFRFRLITSLPLLLLIITGAQGRITESPKNRIALKGENNVFKCCSDGPETLFWKHKPVGSKDTKEIYDLNGLVNGFLKSGRFKVTSGSSPGCYSLSTINVSLEDAGTYTCVDDQGLGQSIGWELVIIESFDCQVVNSKAEYMGANDFGLQQDVVSAKCISKHYGNMRPKPTCEWTSGTQKLENYHNVVETNLTTTTLDFNIPARKEFNGCKLSCYAKISEESRAKENPATWQSASFKINYAFLQQNDVSHCSGEELFLDCQPLCNYNSGRFSNGSSYCEVTYPRETHPKLYVRLHDNSKESKIGVPPSEIRPKTPDEREVPLQEGHQQEPAYFQVWLSGKDSFIMTAIFSGFACMAFGAFVGILTFYFITTRCPQRNSRPTENIEFCERSHQNANGKQRTDDHVNENASPEKKPMLTGTKIIGGGPAKENARFFIAAIRANGTTSSQQSEGIGFPGPPTCTLADRDLLGLED